MKYFCIGLICHIRKNLDKKIFPPWTCKYSRIDRQEERTHKPPPKMPRGTTNRFLPSQLTISSTAFPCRSRRANRAAAAEARAPFPAGPPLALALTPPQIVSRACRKESMATMKVRNGLLVRSLGCVARMCVCARPRLLRNSGIQMEIEEVLIDLWLARSCATATDHGL